MLRPMSKRPAAALRWAWNTLFNFFPAPLTPELWVIRQVFT